MVFLSISILIMESTTQLIRREYQTKEENFEVWIYIDDKQVLWFKAKDVALALDYMNCAEAIQLHVDDENRISPTLPLHLQLPTNWHPKTIFINEAGVYELIIASEKEEAKEFKRWITNDVLPSLRKTGHYSMKQAPIQQQKQMGIMNELLSSKNAVISLLEYKLTNEVANFKRQLDERDCKLESQAKRLKEREEKIKAMEPLVVHQLNDDEKMNCLEVWQMDNDDKGNFRYRGLRVQKRNLELSRKPGERLIFYAETPNAINEWNKLKESVRFTVNYNVLSSTFDKNEFLVLLKYAIPDGKVIETPKDDAEELHPKDDAEELHQTLAIKMPLENFRELYCKVENYINEQNIIKEKGFIHLQTFYRDSGIKCKAKEFVAIAKNILVAKGGKFKEQCYKTVLGTKTKYYNVIWGMILK